MTWDLAVILAVGLLGSAGVAGLVSTVGRFTRSGRISRRIATLAAARDSLAADSPARATLDDELDDLATDLLATPAAGRTRPAVWRLDLLGGAAMAASVVLVVIGYAAGEGRFGGSGANGDVAAEASDRAVTALVAGLGAGVLAIAAGIFVGLALLVRREHREPSPDG